MTPDKSSSPAGRPSLFQVFKGAALNLCPRCRRTHVFFLLSMKAKCPECGYVYEREPGYFVGAMIFSYAFAAFSAIPVCIIGLFIMQQPPLAVVAVACAQILLLTPLLFRYSRLLWIHLDYRLQHDL